MPMTSDTLTKQFASFVDDARKCVDFVIALAQFLFVLPARVQRGLADASGKKA